jgi:hypothetical protein
MDAGVPLPGQINIPPIDRWGSSRFAALRPKGSGEESCLCRNVPQKWKLSAYCSVVSNKLRIFTIAGES